MATSDSPEQPAVVEQDGLVDALVQTSFMTMALLNRIGAEHDLSLTQLRVLAILRDRRLKMTELADYLGLDKSTMTGLVDRAEKRGLLERVRHPTDGRAVDVRISPEGAELAERLYAHVAQSLSPLTSALARADQRRLRALLENMLDRR
jgi:DNA-binding MarR family transcriptional regulator